LSKKIKVRLLAGAALAAVLLLSVVLPIVTLASK
jgi:hypothetical protein